VETLNDTKSASEPVTDSPRAWLRLGTTMLISTIGGVVLWLLYRRRSPLAFA
jgi:hypothetical protein